MVCSGNLKKAGKIKRRFKNVFCVYYILLDQAVPKKLYIKRIIISPDLTATLTILVGYAEILYRRCHRNKPLITALSHSAAY